MEKLKEKLFQELNEISRKPEMGAGDLEVLHKLTDTIKNIDKICILEEEGGYSAAVDGDYGQGSSYANRGKHYVRSHYSREGRGGSSGGRGQNRGQGSRGGYSQDAGQGEMMEHLEMAWDAAPSKAREYIRTLMRELEQD